jgi:hypothetical protein
VELMLVALDLSSGEAGVVVIVLIVLLLWALLSWWRRLDSQSAMPRACSIPALSPTGYRSFTHNRSKAGALALLDERSSGLLSQKTVIVDLPNTARIPPHWTDSEPSAVEATMAPFTLIEQEARGDFFEPKSQNDVTHG